MKNKKKIIFDENRIHLTIDRLCHEVIENHDHLEEICVLGLYPRGVYFANRLAARLAHFSKQEIKIGRLDITFFRDDFRRREKPLEANKTQLDFNIENKRLLIVDDVLYTGRTIRAALSAINSFGRTKDIELLVLIDRNKSRELPIQPNYIGQQVSIPNTQKILVQLTEQGYKKDNICIVNSEKTDAQ